MKEELLKGLTKEQIERFQACHNEREILALAKEEGIELTEEQLDAVAGGCWSNSEGITCPMCGIEVGSKSDFDTYTYYLCTCCGHKWTVPKN